MTESTENKLDAAVARGDLLESAAKNIRKMLTGAPSDRYHRVVEELVEGGAWAELNNRFYKALEFGTGKAAQADHRRNRNQDGTRQRRP